MMRNRYCHFAAHEFIFCKRSFLSLAFVVLGILLSGLLASAQQNGNSPAPPSNSPPASAPDRPASENAGALQSPPVPQAKSPEELAAFQAFMNEKEPDARILLVEDYLLDFPESELKEFAFQSAAEAYQAKNDFPHVITYGELALAENKNNVVALLILATALTERTERTDPDRDENFEHAKTYAERVLEILKAMSKPSHLADELWTRNRNDAEASAYSALGMAFMIREQYDQAESHFRQAVSLAVRPEPVLHYRLGLACFYARKYDSALEALQKSDEQGGVKLVNPDGSTRDLVEEAMDFVIRGRDGWEEPPSDKPLPPPPEPTNQ